MTSKVEAIASSLDIWGIVDRELQQFEDISVEEAWLQININPADSFVEITYHDLTSLVSDMEEKPAMKRISLTQDNIDKMYRDIEQLVHMPKAVQELHVHLKRGKLVEFNVKFVPVLK